MAWIIILVKTNVEIYPECNILTSSLSWSLLSPVKSVTEGYSLVYNLLVHWSACPTFEISARLSLVNSTGFPPGFLPNFCVDVHPLMPCLCGGHGLMDMLHNIVTSKLRTQDSARVYSTQNYTWKYYVRSTLQNSTGIWNKYGPDIIKNAKMHVGKPLLRSKSTAYVEATLDEEGYCAAWWTCVDKLKNQLHDTFTGGLINTTSSASHQLRSYHGWSDAMECNHEIQGVPVSHFKKHLWLIFQILFILL